MDNLQIGIRRALRAAAVLGPATCVVLGCASAPTSSVPARAAVRAALVAPCGASVATGRNDARLGTPREPFASFASEGVATIDDRQRIVNGRPYADYESRVRSATAFSR